MMRIDQITLREIRLALKEPFRISSGEIRERRILLLELRDASGAHTWSECVAGEAPNYSPETIDTAWAAITQWIAPRVLGRTIEHPGELYAELEHDFRGHYMAKAGVEMGAWGLAAMLAGEPLSLFIGGTRTEVAVGISLGIKPRPTDSSRRRRPHSLRDIAKSRSRSSAATTSNGCVRCAKPWAQMPT